MAEAQGRARVPLARSLGMVLGLGAGGALVIVVLLASGRQAAAAELPPAAPVGTVAFATGGAGLAPQGPSDEGLSGAVTVTVPASNAVDAVVASATAGPLTSGLLAVDPSGGLLGPVLTAPALSIPALPVRSSAAPSAPVGVVRQGAPATPNMSSPSLSAAALGVVVRTGSAALLPTPARSAPGAVGRTPPVPTPGPPWRPFLPQPFAALNAAASPGTHASPLDTLPPAVLVLAALVGVLVGPWRDRRLRSRLEPMLSPPG
jgi:hypothetical protein